jgi:hypothetical protein
MFQRKIPSSSLGWKNKPKTKATEPDGKLRHLILLVSCLAYSSALKMEAMCSPKHPAVFGLHTVTAQETAIFK